MYHLLQNTKIQLLIITLLTFLAYSNIFQNQLVLDDNAFIVEWQEGKKLENLPKFFAGNVPSGHQGVYRPVRSILYALYHEIGGDNPFIYHLHSILVHLASTILVYFIIRNLVHSSLFIVSSQKTTNKLTLLPFISSLLFGLHPIHTESITFMTSAMDMTGVVFMLTSFYLYILTTGPVSSVSRQLSSQSLIIASCLFALLAFFTSEITLSLPLLLMLFHYCFRNWKSNLLPYFLLAGFYIFIRFIVLGIINRAPYPGDSIYFTLLTMMKVFAKYIALIFIPLNQANNHTLPGGIEAFIYRGYNQERVGVQSLFNFEILISAVLLLIILLIAIKALRKLPIVTFCIGWFFISLLPVAEIVPQGSVMGERFLYIPSLGFVLLVSYLFVKAGGYLKRVKSENLKVKSFILYLTLLILVSFYSIQTYQRNKDWHDEITFWKHDIAVYPDTNAYAYFQLGNQYRTQGEYNLAIKHYAQAAEINPYFAVSIASIGLVYEVKQDDWKAIEYYHKAVSRDPLFWEGYQKLIFLYRKNGQQEKAEAQFKKYQEIIIKQQ